MSDVELLTRHINAPNARTQRITKALQQHGDHLPSFIKVIDDKTSNLVQGIQDNALEIEKVTLSFQKSLRTLEQSMVNMTQYLITLTNSYNTIRSNLVQLEHAIQSLVEGRISPFLIPKHALITILHQIQSILTKYYPGFYLTHVHPAITQLQISCSLVIIPLYT